MYIGVDFGTTNSMIGFYDKDNNVLIRDIDLFKSDTFPTLLRYNEKWLYGKDCDIDEHYEETIINIKRKIRQSSEKISESDVNAHGYTYATLIKEYIKWLIEKAIDIYREKNEGEQVYIDGIVFTVPSGFENEGLSSSTYSNLIKNALQLDKDFLGSLYRGVLDLVPGKTRSEDITIASIAEPEAAALSYIYDTDISIKNIKILVIDLGGGTLDIAAVEVKKNKEYKIIATDGDLNLGGTDFDELLFTRIKSKIKNDENIEIEKNQKNLIKVKKLKERLSEKSEDIFIDESKMVTTKITRYEFEQCTRSLLNKIKTKIRNVVNRVGGIKEIQKIILVGGGCNMPQIKKAIEQSYPSFSKEDIINRNLSNVVADGAAIKSYLLGERKENNNYARMTYGFKFYKTRYDNTPYIKNLIFKNQPFEGKNKIEAETENPYAPRYINERTVEIFESESLEDELMYEPKKFNTNGLCVKFNAEENMGYYVKIILELDGFLRVIVMDKNKKEIASNKDNIKGYFI